MSEENIFLLLWTTELKINQIKELPKKFFCVKQFFKEKRRKNQLNVSNNFSDMFHSFLNHISTSMFLSQVFSPSKAIIPHKAKQTPLDIIRCKTLPENDETYQFFVHLLLSSTFPPLLLYYKFILSFCAFPRIL